MRILHFQYLLQMMDISFFFFRFPNDEEYVNPIGTVAWFS